jgi:hypothetical protein
MSSARASSKQRTCPRVIGHSEPRIETTANEEPGGSCASSWSAATAIVVLLPCLAWQCWLAGYQLALPRRLYLSVTCL